MTSRPPIFTLAGCPVAGQLGADARLEYANPCGECRRTDNVLEHLHYVFDAWNGEDLITSGPWYAASAQFRERLEQSRLTGFEFHEMTATPAEHFASASTLAWTAVPTFFELRIRSRLDPAAASPSGWWRRNGACPKCGRAIWQRTAASTAGLFAAASGTVGPPREVAARAWDGSDIFYHEDPGPPLVTGAMAEILLTAKGVACHPARWVDDADAS